jgi:hypothetical protein
LELTTSTYQIFISKNGFIDSEVFSIIVEESPTTENPPEEQPTNGGCGSCNTTPNTDNNSDIDTVIKKAFQYLISEQNKDTGSIGGEILSDWVAMAFSKYYDIDINNFEESKNFLKNFITNTDPGNKLTDIERKTIALFSLNTEDKNKYIESLKTQINQKLDENTISDSEAIFGILTLSEEDNNKYTIDRLNKYILDDMPITYLDFHSPLIRALSKTYSIDNTKIQESLQILSNKQTEDGSITNDKDSTAWALDALGTIGELKLTNWFKGDNNPLSFLLSNQNTDGSFSDPKELAPILTTSYVLMSLSYDWDPTKPSPTTEPYYDDPIDNTTTTEDIILDPEITTTTLNIILEEIKITTSTPTPPQEVLGARIKAEPIITPPEPEPLIISEPEIINIIKEPETNKSIEVKPQVEEQEKENSFQKIAEKIFYWAITLTILFILYLVWKFVRTLI